MIPCPKLFKPHTIEKLPYKVVRDECYVYSMEMGLENAEKRGLALG